MTLNCTYVLSKFKVASIVDDEEKGRREERVRAEGKGKQGKQGKRVHQKEELYPRDSGKKSKRFGSDCQQAQLRNVGSDIRGYSNTEVFSEIFREKDSALP